MSKRDERQIERAIPADAADMEPRPVRYRTPLVLPEGTTLDLNDPLATPQKQKQAAGAAASR